MVTELPRRMAADGLTLVPLTPKGGRDALDGIERLADGTCVLKERVRAPLHERAANAGLQKLIAKTLGIAPNRVHLVRGASVRLKWLKIDGDAQTLVRALGKSLAAAAA